VTNRLRGVVIQKQQEGKSHEEELREQFDELKYLFVAKVPEYERLREAVYSFFISRRNNPVMYSAIDRYICIALLRGDFLLKESACIEKINTSDYLHEKNYWISDQYIIHARLGKL
jgi:hypothetical protein